MLVGIKVSVVDDFLIIQPPLPVHEWSRHLYSTAVVALLLSNADERIVTSTLM